MRLLLDTDVLLWALATPDRLSPSTRSAIEDGTNEVFVSAASAWELSIKRALGKLSMPDDVPAAIDSAGFQGLPITVDHALAAGALPPHHRDPFDRMLVAQAFAERLTIVTTDSDLDAYGVALLPA